MNLVEVNRNEIFTDSHVVARKFKYKHAYVVRIIKKIQEDISSLRVTQNHPKVKTEERHYRGTDYVAYLMNRQFFSLLVMRLKSKQALEWQIKFNEAFYEMEKQLIIAHQNTNNPVWLDSRIKGKLARLEETDVIKKFVEYATKQGSKSAKFYYKHITNATYKALDLMVQSRPKLRDTLDMYEISELLLAERLAKNSIEQYMELGRHYKDIYNSVKDDLISFGSILKMTAPKKQVTE